MRSDRHITTVFKKKIAKKGRSKPDFRRVSFWDQVYDEIDWNTSSVAVIARILERGNDCEWEEMFRYYGRAKVEKTIRTRIKYLPNYVIDKVCASFGFEKEDLLCYRRSLSRQGHWI